MLKLPAVSEKAAKTLARNLSQHHIVDYGYKFDGRRLRWYVYIY